MPKALRPNSPPGRSPGFSIVEVLVSLLLTGILMATISMVMGQVVSNDDILKSSQGKTVQAATLRRILHRDISGMQKPLAPSATGFTLISGNNHLGAGPLPVNVEWILDGNTLYRRESESELDYASTMVLASGLRGWQLEVFDIVRGAWIDPRSLPSPVPKLSGLRLSLVLADATQLRIVERIPHVAPF
jgi:type II secretory pathway component PulJ